VLRGRGGLRTAGRAAGAVPSLTPAVADQPHAISMFDYDSRPITPQVVLIGRESSAAYIIRDFLNRNGRPFEWVDVEDRERLGALKGRTAVEPSQLPLCVLPDGTRLAPATVEGVARGLGMVSAPALAEYDLAVVGAGPAGLAASVYAASEGLRTVTIEALAPGGQAGTTSMIENYLGFPRGISGSELATRASAQARHFGAEILLARPVGGLSQEGAGYLARLADGTVVRSRALLMTTGVDWRRLEVPGLEELLGSGVYYGAGPSEAVLCQGCRVAVVGGSNSAGQAVVRFSKYASHVTLLVRGRDLGASMSRYLVDRVTKIENVEVRTSAQIVGVEGGTRLRGVSVSTAGGAKVGHLALDHLFICIGGVPRTHGALELGLSTDAAGYLRTGSELTATRGALDRWELERQPLPLETNLPGLFAAGDVRSGSIKRCAAAVGEGSMAVALVHTRLAETGGEIGA